MSHRGSSERPRTPGGTSPTTSALLHATQTLHRAPSQRAGPVSMVSVRLEDHWCTARSRSYWQQRRRGRERAASFGESTVLPTCDVDQQRPVMSTVVATCGAQSKHRTGNQCGNRTEQNSRILTKQGVFWFRGCRVASLHTSSSRIPALCGHPHTKQQFETFEVGWVASAEVPGPH